MLGYRGLNNKFTLHVHSSFQAGQNLLLYVTVSDGQLTAKTEVYVNIENASGSHRGKTRFVIIHIKARIHIFTYFLIDRCHPSFILKKEILNSEDSGISIYMNIPKIEIYK